MFVPYVPDYLVTVDTLPLGGFDSDTGVHWQHDPIDGWGATGSTLSPVQRVRAGGSLSGKAYPKGRSIGVSGNLYGPSTDVVSRARDQLLAAFSDDSRMFSVLEGTRTRWTMAKKSDEVIGKWNGDQLWTWSAQLWADDWRKFGDTLTGSTALPSTSGGLRVPFTVPFKIDATVVSGQINLTNTGTEVGPVKVRIDGPVTGPIITHRGSQQSLVFSADLTVPAGNWLDIDMEAHTVLENGQASRSTFITSRGWSGFDIGANTWAFSAAVFSADAEATVYATIADK